MLIQGKTSIELCQEHYVSSYTWENKKQGKETFIY